MKSLNKFFKQFKHGQKGFTLIELLVVVAILGVLAAVAIPNVSRFIGQGDDAAADTELANVQLAVTAFMVDNNYSYATIDGTATGTALTTADLVTAGLLDKAPDGTYTIAADGSVTAS